MGQSLQPQPQEDFPFFLSRIKDAMIKEITASKTAPIMMVARFAVSHTSIRTLLYE